MKKTMLNRVYFALLCCCLLFILNLSNYTRSLRLAAENESPASVHHKEVDRPTLQKCKVNAFAFVKNHKCGTMTLTTMFLRSAEEKGLEIALPNSSSWKLDWPNPVRNVHPSRKPSQKYDALVLHAMYDRVTWDRIMEPGYKRISILRSPFEQFKSFFNFFFVYYIVKWKRDLQNQKTDLSEFDEFLANPSRYVNYMYIPSKNVQAFNFGFNRSIEETRDELFEDNFVEKIHKEFDLMLITDYMNESMVLLKEEFCWDLPDVLFSMKNDRPYRNFRDKNVAHQLEIEREEKYKKWATLDYKLFNKFNKTFWLKVRSIKNFEEKLESYQSILNRVSLFCRKNTKSSALTISESENYWKESFQIDKVFCSRWKLKTYEYVQLLQEKRYGHSEKRDPDNFLRNPKMMEEFRIGIQKNMQILQKKSL